MARVTAANVSLIHHKEEGGQSSFGFSRYIGKPDKLKISDHTAYISAKSNGVPDDNPLDSDKCKGDERQGNHGDKILFSHQSAIKKTDSRGHEHDQCGCAEKPCNGGTICCHYTATL